MRTLQNVLKKQSWIETTQECCVLSWTKPWSKTSQKTSSTATWTSSHKLFKYVNKKRCVMQGNQRLIKRDVNVWTPALGRASVDWSSNIYLHQLWMDIRCNLEDLLGVVDDRNEWRDKQRDRDIDTDTDRDLENFMLLGWLDEIHIYIYIYIYIYMCVCVCVCVCVWVCVWTSTYTRCNQNIPRCVLNLDRKWQWTKRYFLRKKPFQIQHSFSVNFDCS